MWCFNLFRREDMGIWGFFLAFLIHIQIYFLIFFMACIAGQMKSLLDRKEIAMKNSESSYNAMELHATT
jgi:hypothetical protein